MIFLFIYFNFNLAFMNMRRKANLLILCTFNDCMYYINPMNLKKQISIIQLIKAYFVLIGRRWKSRLISLHHNIHNNYKNHNNHNHPNNHNTNSNNNCLPAGHTHRSMNIKIIGLNIIWSTLSLWQSCISCLKRPPTWLPVK